MEIEWAATKNTVSRSAAVTATIAPPRTERRPSNSRPSAAQASEPVAAIVKWFNAEKGFGFVAVVGGSEAFMHIRQLEAAGHSSVSEGARVKVRIGQGQKGPEVTEVIEVDTSTAQVTSTTAGRSAPRSSQLRPGVGATTECVGSVKMYNRAKGFGFIGQDGGGKSYRRILVTEGIRRQRLELAI